jgi:tRNA A-37 threonylcarbamoyl transferase component Bud32
LFSDSTYSEQTVKAGKQIKKIDTFGFYPGKILAGKYEVVELLGTGWEGEVYLVRERHTGIERAAKFFFPHRNINNRALLFYARKLHKLQHCPVIIQYYTQEQMICQKQQVSFLVSEFVEGTLLSDFLQKQPGGRLQAFPAIHLLHALATGLECIHAMGEYHGDLHTDNIIVLRFGLTFQLKMLDLYHWGAPSRANIFDDVCAMVRILYDALGGARAYSAQPTEIRSIICGLKRTLIRKKFRTAGELKHFLETLEFDHGRT